MLRFEKGGLLILIASQEAAHCGVGTTKHFTWQKLLFIRVDGRALIWNYLGHRIEALGLALIRYIGGIFSLHIKSHVSQIFTVGISLFGRIMFWDRCNDVTEPLRE
jgi:hypothetical protein